MSSDRFYRLPADVDVVPVAEGRYVVFSDSARTSIEGASAELLAREIIPHLDGRRSIDEICTARGDVRPDDLRKHLDALVAAGVLEVGDAALEPLSPWPALLSRVGIKSADRDRLLGESTVAVVGLEAHGSLVAADLAGCKIGRLVLIDPFPITASDIPVLGIFDESSLGMPRAEALAARLRASGGTHIEVPLLERLDREALDRATSSCDVLVSCFDKGFSSAHHWVNRASVARSVPALYAQSEGHGVRIGPLVVPGRTACFMCYRMRSVACDDDVEGGLAYEHFLDRSKEARLRDRPALPMLFPYIASVVSLEVVKLVLGLSSPALAGNVMEFDAFSLRSEMHAVLRMPDCPVCGDSRATGEDDDAAASGAHGGPDNLRNAAPRLVSRRTGVVREVTAVVKDPSEPARPFVARARLANHRFAKKSEDLFACSGKGMTIEEARLSALGEAVERYSASFWRAEDVTWAPRADLEGDSLDPRELVLYAEDQYADLPYAPYSGDNVLGWVKARSMLDGRDVFVPALSLYMAYETRSEDEFLCPITSNGLAAGASPNDARLRAILEVLERDAFMIAWLAQLRSASIDPGSHPHADIRELVATYRRRGVDLRLHRLPTDHPVHVFAAFLYQAEGEGPAVVAGLGADPSAELAARRAMLEAAQIRPALRRRARSPEMRSRLAWLVADPRRVATLEDHDLLYVSRERTPAFDFLFDTEIEPFDWTAPETSDPEEQLAWLVDHFRRVRQEVLCADLTPPDMKELGLHTARAILPGFQPIDFGWRERRLGGTRLYELPRLLGRAGARLSREDLNPDPHPIA